MLPPSLIHALIDFSGPLGLSQTVEEQFAARDAALQLLSPDNVDALADLASSPPAEVPAWLEAEDWRAAVLDSLIELSRRDTAAALRLAARTGADPVGVFALEALCGVGDPATLPKLADLVNDADAFDEAGQLALIGALAAIAAPSKQALETLATRLGHPPANITAALDAARLAPSRIPTRREVLEALRAADTAEPPQPNPFVAAFNTPDPHST